MKNKLLKTIVVLLSVFIFNGTLSGYLSLNNSVVFAEKNNSESEIVMELNSKRVLSEKNAFDRKYMASTTKIMTAITVIENADISKQITVTDKTVGVEGSSIYLESGEVLTVKDLLYGLMLRSGNDCAETLALNVGGSIENFVKMMNDTAKRIGALNTNFKNPHGLHDDEHYTTAYDLALISCYAMKNEIFREIVGTKTVTIPFTTKNTKRLLKNKNKMLYNVEGATGIKTGYTKKAGRCLVSSVKRNGMELICVVLNCPPMYEKSSSLFDECFERYSMNKIIESDNVIGFSKNEKGKKIGLYVKNDIVLPLSAYEKENLKIEYDYPKTLKCGIDKDEEVGKVKIYIENNLIFTEKIYTLIDTD